MKLIVFFALMSVAVTIGMVSRLAHQEWTRRTLMSLLEHKMVDTAGKEKAIADFKVEVIGLKDQSLAVAKLTEEQKAKKGSILTEKNRVQGELNKCTEEKAAAEKSKTEATDRVAKEKGEHDQAKQGAQKTIQDLKQANLDREKAICALVDTNNAEARSLCGI